MNLNGCLGIFINVEPDPSVHNPPTHRLHDWRNQQRNFINAYSVTQQHAVFAVEPSKRPNPKKDPEVISQHILLIALFTQEEHRGIDWQEQWAVEIMTSSQVRTPHRNLRAAFTWKDVKFSVKHRKLTRQCVIS